MFFTFICRTVRYLKYLPYSTLFEIFAVQDTIWNICRTVCYLKCLPYSQRELNSLCVQYAIWNNCRTVRYYKYARHKSRNLGFQRNWEIVSQKYRIFAKQMNAKFLEKAKFFAIFAKLSHIFFSHENLQRFNEIRKKIFPKFRVFWRKFSFAGNPTRN